MSALFALKEYAAVTRDEARAMFGPGELDEAWGALHCVTPNGDHWTLLGGYDYIRSLQETHETSADPERVAEMPPSSSGAKPSGLGMSLGAVEWSEAAFRPQWAIKGWPDEWSATARSGGAPQIIPWAALQQAVETASEHQSNRGSEKVRDEEAIPNVERFIAGPPVVIPPDATEAERLRLRFGSVPPPPGSTEREAWDRLGLSDAQAGDA